MADYNSSYTGVQIDTAVGHALERDDTPTEGSNNFVASNGIKAAIDGRVTVSDNLFNTYTNVSSRPKTITLSASYADYPFLVMWFNTASSDQSTSRMALTVPTRLLSFGCWYVIGDGLITGTVKIGRSSNTQITIDDSSISTLYLRAIYGVK